MLCIYCKILFAGTHGPLKRSFDSEHNIPFHKLSCMHNSYSPPSILDYFKEMNIWVAEEQSVYLNDPPIAGRYDFLIQHEVYGKTVVELKSINDKGFKSLITDPKPDHYLQLQMYLNLLKLKHGIVLYENKNDQQVKCFEVIRNEEVWTQLLEKCERIRRMVRMPVMCTGEKYCRCKEVPNGKAMDSIISNNES